MEKKGRGIPKEILRELNVKRKDKVKPVEVTAIFETHQIRLTIPSEIRRELNLKKGQKFKVIYDPEKKEIIYKIKNG